jgi:hypothetical protein
MEKVRIGLLSRTGPALPTSARYVYAPNGSVADLNWINDQLSDVRTC